MRRRAATSHVITSWGTRDHPRSALSRVGSAAEQSGPAGRRRPQPTAHILRQHQVATGRRDNSSPASTRRGQAALTFTADPRVTQRSGHAGTRAPATNLRASAPTRPHSTTSASWDIPSPQAQASTKPARNSDRGKQPGTGDIVSRGTSGRCGRIEPCVIIPLDYKYLKDLRVEIELCHGLTARL